MPQVDSIGQLHELPDAPTPELAGRSNTAGPALSQLALPTCSAAHTGDTWVDSGGSAIKHARSRRPRRLGAPVNARNGRRRLSGSRPDLQRRHFRQASTRPHPVDSWCHADAPHLESWPVPAGGRPIGGNPPSATPTRPVRTPAEIAFPITDLQTPGTGMSAPGRPGERLDNQERTPLGRVHQRVSRVDINPLAALSGVEGDHQQADGL